jgi:hypothetical protein
LIRSTASNLCAVETEAHLSNISYKEYKYTVQRHRYVDISVVENSWVSKRGQSTRTQSHLPCLFNLAWPTEAANPPNPPSPGHPIHAGDACALFYDGHEDQVAV